MRLGKIKIIIIVFFFFNINLYAEDRILSAPIINLENLDKIKPESKIIFGILKIAKCNVAPARIISIY